MVFRRQSDGWRDVERDDEREDEVWDRAEHQRTADRRAVDDRSATPGREHTSAHPDEQERGGGSDHNGRCHRQGLPHQLGDRLAERVGVPQARSRAFDRLST
jgi:hypothetical protein